MINNYKINNEDIITYVGDIPEDTKHASKVGLEFQYEVYVNGKPADFIPIKGARSEQVGDEIVWVYYMATESREYEILYWLIPGLLDEWIDFTIDQVSREKLNNTLDISFNAEFNNDYYTKNENGEIINVDTGVDIYKDIDFNLFINGTPFNQEIILDSYEENNIKFSFKIVGDFIYENINISLTVKNISPDTPNFLFEDNILLNSRIENEFNIDFSKNKQQTILSPISYDGETGEYIFEEIIFEKEFDNILSFPRTINNLITFKYNDHKTDFFPANIPQNIVGEIDMQGYSNSEINIETLLINNNNYEFICNDPMYYNENYKQVWDGNSNGEYLDENGIIIPWDKSENYGFINFEIEFQTYIDYKINFSLPIGNDLSLRGKDGRFEFIEVY